jgi:hypothetical protein
MESPSDALEGRVVWIRPDRERSRFFFSPRKGVIERVIEKFPQKDGVLIRLLPPTFIWQLFPRRLTHVLLRYSFDDDDSIQRTFRLGLSAAEVYRPSRKVTKSQTAPEERDLSKLGIAIVFPWPIPSAADMRERISADKQTGMP